VQRPATLGASTSERILAAFERADLELSRSLINACADEWSAVHRVNGVFVDELLRSDVGVGGPAKRWTQTANELGSHIVESLAGRPVGFGDLSGLTDELIKRARASLNGALAAAIDGRRDEAAIAVRAARSEYVDRHDAWVILIQALMRRLNIEHGNNAVNAVLARTGRMLMSSRVSAGVYDADRLLEMHARGMRGHPCDDAGTGSFLVEEHDDRYELTFEICGSGGRLRRSAVAELGWLLDAHGRSSGTSTWTAGYADVPLYCTHCFVCHEVIGVELTGFALRHTMFDADPTAPCRWVVYKAPSAVPVELTQRSNQHER
jgi:hypothetical protein